MVLGCSMGAFYGLQGSKRKDRIVGVRVRAWRKQWVLLVWFQAP